MRLRSGLRVLRRGADEVQVGTDPRWAVRVTGLAPDEVDVLVTGSLDAFPLLAGQLSRVGLAVEDTPTGPASADDAAWGLLRPDDTAAARARRRGTARVGIVGLGPTGVGVAVALAAAGVGTLELDDERPVRPTDVGVFRWQDVGIAREQVAARMVRDAAPRVAVGGRGEPDVVVVVESHGADPARAALLVGHGVAHLSVVVREADTVVGPLVVPGAGPCLRCLDLHRAETDPAWPVLLGQLVGADAADEPGTVAQVAAGVAAAAVLAVVDGLTPPVGRTWEVGLPDAIPRERTWQPHAACGCATLP